MDETIYGFTFEDALTDALDALAISMKGTSEVVAAISVLDRQLVMMLRAENPCPQVALDRVHGAREILGRLRRLILAGDTSTPRCHAVSQGHGAPG